MKKILLISLSAAFLVCACAPKKPSRPTQPQDIFHVVSWQGETLSLIADWYTGSSGNWPLIADANPGIRPNRLRLGESVTVPGHLAIRQEPLPREVVLRAVKAGTTTAVSAPQPDTSAGDAQDAQQALEAANEALAKAQAEAATGQSDSAASSSSEVAAAAADTQAQADAVSQQALEAAQAAVDQAQRDLAAAQEAMQAEGVTR